MTAADNNNHGRINSSGEVPFIEFPLLSNIPFIIHGFSTRLGGVSTGFFSSMNLGGGSSPDGDNRKNIRENFIRISRSLGVDPHSLVVSDQVHKLNIRIVDEADRGKGFDIPKDYKEIDGLITNKPGITLVTKYADCVPLFFVDPVKKAIGLSHSGWRGTVGKIGHITTKEMGKAFGSRPEDIIAVIGPSICTDCYEVGEEVAAEFKQTFADGDGDMPVLRENHRGRYQLNLWETNRRILLEAGLRNDNIHTSGICTCCNSELLFSHRKTGGKRGSLAAFLAMKEDRV